MVLANLDLILSRSTDGRTPYVLTFKVKILSATMTIKEFCMMMIDILFLFAAEEPLKCKATVDIGFILDPVDSSKNTLLKQKQFLKSIANSFTSSSNGSRFGLIASDNLSDMIKLKDHKSTSDFSKAVDELTSSDNGAMRIDKAIEGAYKDLFDPVNGARIEVPRVLVILSARKSSSIANPALLSKAISPFQEDGTKVLVVSIGSEANNPILKSLASNANDFYVAERVEDISKTSLQTKIVESACSATGKFSLRIYF